MRARATWTICVIVCFLVVGFVGSYFVRTHTQDPDNDKKILVKAWSELASTTSQWLASRQYQLIRSKEEILLRTKPKPEFALQYAEVAINCAKERETLGDGDPYYFYSASERALNLASTTTSRSDLVLTTARGLYQATSYRRALRLLDRISTANTAEAQTLRPKLLAALATVRETVPSDKANRWESDSIASQLLDLLGTVPEPDNSTDGPSPSNGNSKVDKTAEDSSGVVDHPENSSERAATHKGPFLLSALKESASAITATHSGQKGGEDAEGAVIHDVQLSISEQRLANDFVAVSTTDVVALRQEIIETDFASILVRHLPDDARLRCKKQSDINLQFVDGITLVTVEAGSERCFFFLRKSEGSAIRVSGLQLPGTFAFYPADLLAQGTTQLVGTSRQGSGQFLSVIIVDPNTLRILWEEDGLHFGQIAFVQLKSHRPKQILAIEKSGLVAACEQCSDRLSATLYDYSSNSGRFEPVGRTTSYAAMNLAPIDSPWGLGSSNDLTLPDERGETPLDRARVLVGQIRHMPPSSRSEQLLSTTKDLFSNLDSWLMESGQYSLNEERQADLVSAIGTDRITASWQSLRNLTQLRRINSMLVAGQYEKGLGLCADPGFFTNSTALEQIGLYNTKGMLYQALGRFSSAYDSYMSALKLAHDSSVSTVEIEGNLATYFRIIGDSQSSYFHARTAVDASQKEGEGLAVNMLSLAAASAELSNEDEAVDWANRALTLARRTNGGGIGMSALQIGAHIALKHNQPDLALVLLDEAFTMVNGASWSVDGGDFLLLYASALYKERYSTESTHMLLVSAELSQTMSTRSYVAALYELSRLKYSEHSLPEALSFAQRAFEGISSARQQIGREEQKFAFLANKQSVAAWLFKLLLESNANATDVLRAVESWKMRTFLDVHSGKAKNSDFDVGSLPQAITDVVDDGDLVLDLVVTDEVSFGIAVSKNGGTRFFRLGNSAASILEKIRVVSESFDLTRPAKLNDIRTQFVDETLANALQDLSQAILGPAPIPTGTRRLIIVADNQLLGLPWAALPLDHRESVVDRYQVVVVPSAIMEVWAARRAQTIHEKAHLSPKALVVCNVAGARELNTDFYGTLHTLNLPPLAKGWAECQNIVRLFGDMPLTLMVDSETAAQHGRSSGSIIASPENFKEAASSATIIHVVAHGLFDRSEPMHSKVFLGASGEARPLTAAALSELNLERTEFVTLASCQTAISGSAPAGEPLGFLRGVLAAGVPSVMLAEWEIDDDVTSQLLIEYYLLARTTQKSEALRRAQLQIRKKYRHPYFWAGISLYGYGN